MKRACGSCESPTFHEDGQVCPTEFQKLKKDLERCKKEISALKTTLDNFKLIAKGESSIPIKIKM